MKGALKASTDPTNWVDMLPLVLLGIRTSLKEDLRSSTAELVYGTTLRLPGEFFHNSDMQLDPATYVSRLRSTMQQLQPPKVRQQASRKTYVCEDLKSCTHVFLRHDAVKKPLQKPYDGPYKVIKRQDKHFTLEVKGSHTVVSIDRLKPAYLDESPSALQTNLAPSVSLTTPSPSKPIITRSGRQVHWPKKYISYSRSSTASLEGE